MPLFEGILTAAVTPSRDDRYEIDMGAALEVVDYLNDRKIRGIALFGATGEFPHFSVEDRIRFTSMAVKRSRVPVIVNVTHSAFEASEQMAEAAAAAGAAAVMAQPPHYFRYGPAEIREFFLDLVDEVDGQAPVYLYNLPAFNNPIPVEVAVELLVSGQFAGIKDSSGNPDYLSALLAARQAASFNLIIGNDVLFTHGRLRGAHGVISGCACAIPEAMLALDAAILAGDTARVEKLDRRLSEFIGQIDQFPGPNGIREALVTRGLKMGRRAIPFAPETERKATQFREWFKGWLAVTIQEAKQ
ncbi:MAG: dihydrodipicolinate synthase family protein [Bryobacteraceae bacterium]|nr:dihydrodipicolinate synthase family protein [Bryobacteraceae bacterium]